MKRKPEFKDYFELKGYLEVYLLEYLKPKEIELFLKVLGFIAQTCDVVKTIKESPHEDVMQILMECERGNQTLLGYFCKEEEYANYEIIKFLIDRKSQVDFKNPNIGGQSLIPFNMACSNKNTSLETIKLLLENGAKINAKAFVHEKAPEMSPLHEACMNNKPNLEIIKFLVENKAEVNAKDNSASTDGCSPANYLIDDLSKDEDININEIIGYLIEQKAELTHNDFLLEITEENKDLSSQELFEAWVEAGGNEDSCIIF